ncbi:ankyrin repeat domain-containing protein [Herbaspirillum sp. ST 5-3]|uniref:ankyrin repeat domain-containing protein n=1 Tax=Oxalobacteraceae TaxID=75682 RepID=UPI0010A576D9|nr:ankyrin repeat domain-containing protein [Herbaspirillum sp. ST 5-3]
MRVSPSFTPDFYRLPSIDTRQPTPPAQTPQPIRFPQFQGQSIDQFIASPDFERCQQEYAQLIDRITQFVDDHVAQLSPSWLPDTVEEIKDNFAELKHHLSDLHLDFFSQHKSDVYGTVKEMFHKLEELLQQEEIPLAKRMEVIQEMAPKMAVCAGGIVKGVQDAITSLITSTAGIEGAVQHTKIKMSEAFILDHVRHTHRYLPGNEVHFANAYFNYLAEEMGVPVRPDPFTTIAESEISDAQFEACKQNVRAKLTPTSLALAMAEDYSSKIRDAIAAKIDDVSEPIADALYPAVRAQIEDLQMASLNRAFGEVPMDRYLLLQPDTYQYKMAQQPTLIARHFMAQLRKKDMVNHDDAIQLNPDGDQAGKIMQLGELFWVDKDGSCDELDAQALARLSPQAIAQALKEKGSAPQSAYAEIFENIARHLMEAHQAGKVQNMPVKWFADVAGVFSNRLQPHVPLGTSVVMLAAAQGNAAALRVLPAAGADIHATNDDGQTAAMMAAKNGHADALRVLIDAGVGIHAKDRYGMTAAMYAGIHGNAEALQVLRLAGVDINAVDNHGMTAAMIAAKNGNAEALRALHTVGVNFDVKDPHGITATMFAAANGHDAALQALRDVGADLNVKDNNGMTAAMFSARNGHVKALEVLIGASAEVKAKDHNGVTAAMYAAMKGHAKALQILHDAGADINAANNNGLTAAMLAAGNGHTEALQVLHTAGADFDVQDHHGVTAAMYAAMKGHAGALRALIDAGVTIKIASNKGMTAAMYAARNGRADALRVLVAKDADIDATNKKGITAAMMAAGNGHLETLQVLIEVDAKINVQDPHGMTALMYAGINGRADALRALIEAGAHINATDNKGMTTAMHAAEKGHADALRVLHTYGADLNAMDYRAVTAAMYAAKNGHAEVLRVLIGAGTNIKAKNVNDLTAAMMAEANGHPDALQVLREAEAAAQVNDSDG